MSLADELLADLEDGIDSEPTITEDDLTGGPQEIPEASMDVDIDTHSVKNVAKLRDSEQLRDILDQIEFFKQKGKREGVYVK